MQDWPSYLSVYACVWICFERWLKFQSIRFCHSNFNIYLLIEMIKLWHFTAVLKPNKRPVHLFLCLQAAYVDILGVAWL